MDETFLQLMKDIKSDSNISINLTQNNSKKTTVMLSKASLAKPKTKRNLKSSQRIKRFLSKQ